MPLQVTAIYAGLLCLIGVVLAGMVGPLRGRTHTSLGDGGNRELIEAMWRRIAGAAGMMLVPIAAIVSVLWQVAVR